MWYKNINRHKIIKIQFFFWNTKNYQNTVGKLQKLQVGIINFQKSERKR